MALLRDAGPFRNVGAQSCWPAVLWLMQAPAIRGRLGTGRMMFLCWPRRCWHGRCKGIACAAKLRRAFSRVSRSPLAPCEPPSSRALV